MKNFSKTNFKKRKHHWKTTSAALIVTLIFTIILSPFYTDMLQGFIDSRTNGTAYINVTNNHIKEFLISSTENKNGLPSFKKEELKDYTRLLAKINSYWKTFSICYTTQQKSMTKIELSGPFSLSKDVEYPIIIDYRDFKVNEKIIFKDIKNIWQENPYRYQISSEPGEKVCIQIQIRKHHLNLRTLTKIYSFNFCLFLSIFILSFLLSYRLVQYISKFKLLENNSRIDIIFVLSFFLLLFLPMSHISQEIKSEKENRLLMPSPSLFIHNKLNLNYGIEFEKWFNDRFFGRKMLINFHAKWSVLLDKYGKNTKAGIYKDEWLLNTSELTSFIKETELENINKGIRAYRDFCAAHHIKCYIEIVPRKMEFIKDKTFRIIPKNEEDRAKRIVESVKKTQEYDIIYPKKELEKANKTDLVFFKTDHHWTEWGAYIGYLALIERIKQDFENIKPVSEKEYKIFYDKKAKGDYDKILHVGSTCMLLHLKDKSCPLNTDYRYYQHKQEDKFKMKRDDKMAIENFTYPLAQNKQKVMIIGNSFIENFAVFSSYTFPTLLNRRSNNVYEDNLNLSRWKDEVLKEKINIVVILISSEYSNHLQDLEN